ncbi:MAG: hypothetical protein WDO19_15480 [Bacteroidota bacterium]
MPKHKDKSQYAAGNFKIKVVTKNNVQPQITVADKAEPNRLLWQTVPGAALVGAAIAKGAIIIHGIPQGQFKVKDTIVAEFDKQTISSISLRRTCTS